MDHGVIQVIAGGSLAAISLCAGLAMGYRMGRGLKPIASPRWPNLTAMVRGTEEDPKKVEPKMEKF